ncbi:hypothetical protein [Corynebacterium diphtheriae]|uniref:hypothetical protein n=1 Tax=Corynebacterium diphtheriae TaxID=1717 RepID=UPI0002E64EF8|nr:hypothetical protein [Corynebacterium diphtheriae]VEJ67332.1 Uncharacterised protein [Corynebacterium diphtheriae]
MFEAKNLNDQAVLDQKAAEECAADEAAKADKNQGDGDKNQKSEGGSNSKFFGILAAVLGGLGLAGLVTYFMPMIMKFFNR